MKNHYTLLLIGSMAASVASGQIAAGMLDVNNARVRFNAAGTVGMDGANPGYFLPKMDEEEGPSPLFVASLWIGGYTADGELHLAGERYPGINRDFYPGALGTGGQISGETSVAFNKVWNVYRSDVEAQTAYFHCLAEPDCDPETEYAGYSVPAYFYEWPAHGDADLGQAYNLADFHDFDGDGFYDPDNGDTPCIPGDQALFSIYNDNLHEHSESGGARIGAEVHMTSFAYASGVSAIHNTVFVRYRIFNRDTLTLHDTYLGLFTDFDLGCPHDDYLGCDVGRNLFYVMNAVDPDNGCLGRRGYGSPPPAFGVAVLKGPLMDADGTDNTDLGTLPGYNGTGFNDGIADNERHGLGYFMHMGAGPGIALPEDHYRFMTGAWDEEHSLTYGGTGYSDEPDAVPARFAYPGASDPLGVGTGGTVMPSWTEVSAGNPPWDRRGMGSLGPFTFKPGDMQEILVAYVYAKVAQGGPAASVQALQVTTDTILDFAASMPGLLAPGVPCQGLETLGVSEVAGHRSVLRVYPSPANDRLMLELPVRAGNMEVQVMDMTGRVVIGRRLSEARPSVDVSKLSPGLYVVQVNDGRTGYEARFVKE